MVKKTQWVLLVILFYHWQNVLVQIDTIISTTLLDILKVTLADMRPVNYSVTFSVNKSFCQIFQNCIRAEKIQQKSYF